LPSINETSFAIDSLVESLREPTNKLERLNELALKYKKEQD
jgi:hypothetical protein